MIKDGYSTAAGDSDRKLSATIQAVGNFSIKYTSDVLTTLAEEDSTYTGISNGTISLVGFKLESTMVSADQQIDNSKVVPLVNGDSITLTNICKAGTLSLTAARTAAGLNGGDCVAVFDYVRSQGDVGGKLTITWIMNGNTHTIIFAGVCVKRCAPLVIAGNDVPDYQIQLTYSNYSDSDSPAYNESI